MANPSAYLVCATQRSGSTLLVESLAESGIAGRPAEFFQYLPETSLAPQPRDWLVGAPSEVLNLLSPNDIGVRDLRSSAEWQSDVLAAGRSANGVWGGKLMWNQTPLLVNRLAAPDVRSAITTLLGADPLYLHVTRKDVVPQAVSFWRAVQTRKWRGDGGNDDNDGAQYNADGIAHLAAILLEQERQWQRWFAAEGLTPVEIEFADLIRDPQGFTGKILATLGLDPAAAPPPPLKPQSNARSKEWVQRYREDAERRDLPR